MSVRYELTISADIERRIGRCRAQIREAIRDRLQQIAVSAGEAAPHPGRARSSFVEGPTLRFYVYEGYRVFYRLDPQTRRVVVMDLGVVRS